MRIGHDGTQEVVLDDVQHVQRGAERPGQRTPVRERGIRGFTKVSGDENVFQCDHGGLAVTREYGPWPSFAMK